jgi:hypothetical protein
MRRMFEAESKLPALLETVEGKREQTFSGILEEYHRRFLVWATKRLALEREAPPAIKRQLSLDE